MNLIGIITFLYVSLRSLPSDCQSVSKQTLHRSSIRRNSYGEVFLVFLKNALYLRFPNPMAPISVMLFSLKGLLGSPTIQKSWFCFPLFLCVNTCFFLSLKKTFFRIKQNYYVSHLFLKILKSVFTNVKLLLHLHSFFLLSLFRGHLYIF